MINRIDRKWLELKKQGKKAFIPYITAGYPTLHDTIQQVKILEESGADIIEIGIPFSDPIADGPVLQEVATISIKNGFTLSKFWEAMKVIRIQTTIPLVLLTYYNTIYHTGIECFTHTCKEIGIDGLIIPDLPVEEQEELQPYLDSALYLIPLVAPTSKQRMPTILANAKGYVYCISSLGVTGTRSFKDLSSIFFLQEVRKHTSLPLAIGFGLSTQEDIQYFQPYVDGIIMGTAIVQHFKEGNRSLNFEVFNKKQENPL